MCDWCACFRLLLMTALTSTSMRVVFRHKDFDNCSLFRNLVSTPTIAANPTSQMYEDEKGSSTFRASVERVGHVCWTRWFAELFFDPEDGGDTFLRNVGCNSTDYTALYPRRWYSSQPELCLSSLWSLSNPESVKYSGEGVIRRIIYGVYYMPYFLPFSNFVLFFHFSIPYDF
jgi:hypothetical protein